MPTPPYKSKLVPYRDFISDLRSQYPPVTYQEIVRRLKEEFDVDVTANTIFQFVKARSRKNRFITMLPGANSISTPNAPPTPKAPPLNAFIMRIPDNFSGVYVLRQLSEVMYVGQSSSVRARVLTHWPYRFFDSVEIISIPDQSRRMISEKALIAALQPKMNRCVPSPIIFYCSCQESLSNQS